MAREYATIEGPGLMFWNGNGMTMLAGFGRNATVTGSDQNTTLVCIGRGDITAFFGDGRNLAIGGAGNDIFFGGTGVNRFFGEGGDDILVRGEGYNDLNGGSGNDVIALGQWDQAVGGLGADRFIIAAKTDSIASSVFIRDLSFAQGDRLDLSMMLEVTRANLDVRDDALVCYTPDGGTMNIEGVGYEIMLVGGIDVAVNTGYLSVFGDYNGRG